MSTVNAAASSAALAAKLRAEFEPYFRIARLIGLENDQAAVAAARAVKEATGHDPLAIMEVYPLLTHRHSIYLSAAALGERLGMHQTEVNCHLFEREYQVLCRDDQNRPFWAPTEKGQPHAIWLDLGNKHSDGTPVRQLGWSAGILLVLTAAKSSAD